jgi:hypothetical protein
MKVEKGKTLERTEGEEERRCRDGWKREGRNRRRLGEKGKKEESGEGWK